jgi:hypothetical protein
LHPVLRVWLGRKFTAQHRFLDEEDGFTPANHPKQRRGLNMFHKTILAAVAAVALTVTPGLGTSNADAHPPVGYYHHDYYHHDYYHHHGYCPPVIVSPVVVTPVCHQFEVYFRPGCNMPWQCGGTFTTRFGADQRMSFYQSQGCESYIAMR